MTKRPPARRIDNLQDSLINYSGRISAYSGRLEAVKYLLDHYNDPEGEGLKQLQKERSELRKDIQRLMDLYSELHQIEHLIDGNKHIDRGLQVHTERHICMPLGIDHEELDLDNGQDTVTVDINSMYSVTIEVNLRSQESN